MATDSSPITTETLILRLLNISEECKSLGVDLVSLRQSIDTTLPSGRLTFQILGAVAEFERELGKPVRASKSDRRVRDLMFPTSSGDVPIRTRSSRDATKLSEFFHDRDKFLRGKLSATDFESRWRGLHVAGKELE